MTAEKSAAWAAYLLNGGLAKYAEFSGAITAPPQLNDAAKLAAIRLLNSVSDHSGLRQFVAKVELTGRGQNQIPLPG